MKKLITTIFAIGLFIPLVAEAGFSQEGRHKGKKPRCKDNGSVVVCRMPRHKKPKRCGIMPCIPRGYYRPNPPKRIPMNTYI